MRLRPPSNQSTLTFIGSSISPCAHETKRRKWSVLWKTRALRSTAQKWNTSAMAIHRVINPVYRSTTTADEPIWFILVFTRPLHIDSIIIHFTWNIFFIQTESTWRLKYEPLQKWWRLFRFPQQVITGTGNITAAEQNMAKEMTDKDKVYANKITN